MTVKLCLNEECITQQIKLCPTETQTSALPPLPLPSLSEGYGLAATHGSD